MKNIKINETPVRTSRNFRINNIKLENIDIPEKIDAFENITIKANNISSELDKNILTYGLSQELTKQVEERANQKIKIIIDKEDNETEIFYNFDSNNLNLIDNIQIVAEENVKATVMIKYKSEKDIKCYHNGIINVLAKKDSKLIKLFISTAYSIGSSFAIGYANPLTIIAFASSSDNPLLIK